ncbi:uncharacterized protein DFL_004217 [Arthrobotrys flagrans]|uniref:Clr5 domain-containing protein n=1 Tax=Arthrobotrys flagrans TaxID=97331 RepID=A0A437A463_ARTFL|nr:hypothetical protein DFL_004217 [Arthrobotrys flagrans]
MWIPPQSTSKKSLEVNQYVGDKSLKKRAYVKMEEWEPHKDFVLRQRHAKVKEKDILHALRHERGFMVEMHQLKKVLQLWNSKRNLKRKQRDYIVQIVKERRRAGKNQTIFYHPSGTLIDLPEVKEIMRRYGNSEPLEPPSPGGLIPGSPRLRQTPPDILFNNREISPNYNDHLSLNHSNTSPGSLGNIHSPIVETGLEYTTPPHLAIDLFLQQTTAQSSANVMIPTTLGYPTDISPGAVYPPVGFGDELSMSSIYSNRPAQFSEIDPSLEYRLQRPTLPAPEVSPSSITTRYFPGPLSSSFFQGPPPAAVPSAQCQPISESYSYPPSAPAPAPPRRPSPGRYAPPAPPPMQPAAPPPPSVPPQPKSKSIFSFPRFGFSSKKSSQPPMASGGSIVQLSAPASAPYMQPGASADQFFPPPQSAQAPSPPPIAAPGVAAGAPTLPPSDSRFRASNRTSARRTSNKEPFIKDEFAEISTLDYSRGDSKKAKGTNSFGYSGMADRAGRLLSGMPPKEDGSSKRARQRAEEEEAIQRKAEEARLESQRLEQQKFFVQEQERLRALEEARLRAEEEEARHRESERAYTQPEQMEVDEDAEWSDEEAEEGRGPGLERRAKWKQEPEEEDDWGEEDSWQDSATLPRFVDAEHQRLQETFQRVSGKITFYPPIIRLQLGHKVGNQHQKFARVESKKLVFDVDDTFKIKLKEIRNDGYDDVVSALGDLSVSDKDKKDDGKDLASALEGLKVSNDKKESGEKWDDEEEEEEWSEDEEKEDEWGEGGEKEDEWGEKETGDKWGDSESDKVLAKLDDLTLSENLPAVTKQEATATEKPATVDAATVKLETRSKDYIPFKRLLTVEFGDEEFHQLEFASDDMEQVYRIHLRDWLKEKVDDAEWKLGMTPVSLKKSDGKKFLDDTDKRRLPIHIYKATKHLVKADMDPNASEAEVQYETKIWNWVLKRHKQIISYMKENSDTYWTALWSKTEQAIVYFLPFLGKRFGTKHWFTLEGIKVLGESYLWEKIGGGWKYGLQLRNLAYDGFVSLGFENAGIVSDCIDDGVTERERREGRRKMELRRAVEHYRTIREDFGDWSQLGVYAIGLLIRALARVDKERAKKLIPIATAGFLEIPRAMWWRREIANSIWLVGEAMREVGMVKESVAFLWKTMPAMRKIEGIVESLPSVRVLGGIAEGFQVLGKAPQAILWREIVLEVASEALGRDHPETVFWAKRAQRGLEARGIQFLDAPTLTMVELIGGRLFLEGKIRRADQKKLLKFTRKVIRKLEPDGR